MSKFASNISSDEAKLEDMILPNFLICGAQKAGTTALHRYLKQHPDVFMSRPKETWFFDERYDRGIEWFSTHFEEHNGESAIGEATARTMSTPEAPARIAKHLPNARLLFILRNPIDRAYSQYHYYVYTGKVKASRSFHEVIQDKKSEFREDMIRRGMYVRQLKRFEEHFDRTQMKIILHEELRDRTDRTVRDVCRFLDVDPNFQLKTESKHNVTRYPDSLEIYHWLRQGWHLVRGTMDRWFPEFSNKLRRVTRHVLFSEEKPEMQEEDRAYLQEIYKEPNSRLEQHINRDLSHWK